MGRHTGADFALLSTGSAHCAVAKCIEATGSEAEWSWNADEESVIDPKAPWNGAEGTWNGTEGTWSALEPGVFS